MYIDPITVYDAQFGLNTTNIIILDEVQCRGDETSLIECRHAGIGRHDCISSEAAGAVCRGNSIIIALFMASTRLPSLPNGKQQDGDLRMRLLCIKNLRCNINIAKHYICLLYVNTVFIETSKAPVPNDKQQDEGLGMRLVTLTICKF